jgi:hypothetical protein
MKKNFETELWVNDRKVPLNHFVQEIIANIMVGFVKTLKELEGPPHSIKIETKRLAKSIGVDAHTYP